MRALKRVWWWLRLTFGPSIIEYAGCGKNAVETMNGFLWDRNL